MYQILSWGCRDSHRSHAWGAQFTGETDMQTINMLRVAKYYSEVYKKQNVNTGRGADYLWDEEAS